MNRDLTKEIQRKVGVKADGDLGPITLAAIAKALGIVQTNEPSKLARLLVEIAREEIGVKEVPSNRGERVEEYQRATSLDGTGWPWCAAFICWLFQQAETSHPLLYKRPTTAAAFGFEEWARKAGVKLFMTVPDEILEGDILVFEFSHIGIAEKDSGKGKPVECIEGNTDAAGSREGGGVWRKTRNRSLIRSVIRL